MNELLHSWVTGLTAAAVLSAAALLLTPPGPVARVTRFVCGVMLMAVLCAPLCAADGEVYALSLAEYRHTAQELTQDLEGQQNRLLRTYIEQESAAYILDEAQALGIAPGAVRVDAKWGDESWIPYEAYLELETTDRQRDRLAALLLSALGIPAERQHWG